MPRPHAYPAGQSFIHIDFDVQLVREINPDRIVNILAIQYRGPMPGTAGPDLAVLLPLLGQSANVQGCLYWLAQQITRLVAKNELLRIESAQWGYTPARSTRLSECLWGHYAYYQYCSLFYVFYCDT